jgi:hypothetical protein
MARAKAVTSADPKAVAAFRKQAEKKGGRVIEQLPINGWADHEIGFILSGDFVAIREGKAKKGSDKQPGHLLDIIESETGEPQTWGCPAVLRSRLEQHAVKKGDSMEIMLSGQLPAQGGNNPAWDFVVAIYPKGE